MLFRALSEPHPTNAYDLLIDYLLERVEVSRPWSRSTPTRCARSCSGGEFNPARGIADGSEVNTSQATVVKAQVAVRAGVGILGVAILVGSIGASLLIGAFLFFTLVGGVAGVMLLFAALSWGKVTELVIDSAGVTIHAGEYTRHIPRAEVGGAWLVGSLLGDWALDLGFGFMRPVLLAIGDPQGQVVVARRIAWVRGLDLAQAFSAHGIPFGGEWPFTFHATHLRPSAWPTDVTLPQPGPGRSDPATRTEIARLRKRARLQAAVGWAIVIGLPWIAGALHTDDHRQPLYGFAWFLGTTAFVTFWFVASGPIRSRPWRAARRILRTQPWYASEVLLLGWNQGNATKRYVVVLDRVTGQPHEAYQVKQGGEHGWLQPVERRWLLVTPNGNGKKAIAAPPDRSGLALLARDNLAKVLASTDRRGAG